MNRAVRYLSAVILFCTACAPAAFADSPAPGMDVNRESPLMIIRFNQQQVGYAMPLYKTLSRALEIKPSAVFDVISVAPRAHGERNQSFSNRMASRNTHKVLATMHNIGLPANRISLTNAIDDVSSSEVRIFVH